MRITILVALAVLAMALVMVLFNRGDRDGTSTPGEHPASSSDATAVTNRGALATAWQAWSEPSAHPTRLGSAVSAATATNSTNAAEFVAAILANPAQPPLPSTIPALSDAQVDQLATALVQIDLPADKYGILWALAFSQNERAFDVLRYVLVEEYSGRSVRSVDNAALQKATKLVGVLARTSDRAWQFLVDLTRPEGWGRLNLWSEDYLTETYDSEELSKAQVNSGFQTSIISAMAVSGRPEFREWADSLMRSEGGPDDFTKPAVSAITYGVFIFSHIAEHGFATFDDDVQYNVRGGSTAYGRWVQTEEGQTWSNWWQEHAAALNAARATVSQTP